MKDNLTALMSLLLFVGFFLPANEAFMGMLGWAGAVVWSTACFISMVALAGKG